MSGPAFHATGCGRRYFDVQIPRLIEHLGRIADVLEKIAVRLEPAPQREPPTDKDSTDDRQP